MTPSLPSLVAAGLYFVVMLAGAVAFLRAVKLRQTGWHRWSWAIIAIVFVILALLRLFAVEELLRSDLRSMLFDEFTYDRRRTYQAPLFAVIFLIAAAGAAGLFYVMVKGVRGRRNVAAIAAISATCGMIFLLALRRVSLHSVDQLLYGPLKLNWIADLGMTFVTLGSAVRYTMLLRSAEPSPRVSAR